MYWAEEASKVSIGGGGSCDPLPRRWKELHTEATMTEENCAWRLGCRTRSSVTEEALVLCVCGGGRSRGSIGGGGRSCTRVDCSGSRGGVEGWFYGCCKRKLLVGSIVLFNWTKLQKFGQVASFELSVRPRCPTPRFRQVLRRHFTEACCLVDTWGARASPRLTRVPRRVPGHLFK